MWLISDLMSRRSPLSAVRSPLSLGGRHPREHASSCDGHEPASNDWQQTTDHGPLTTDLRVVLFDIDGTLIKTVRRGEYRGLIHSMLLDVFGTCGRINEVDFAGRTDLAIYREALECEGITPVQIRERLPLVEAAAVEILNHLASTGDV